MADIGILLTAFEPFGGAPRNPSAEVVSRIGRDLLPGVTIHSAVLPVSSRRAPEILARQVRERKPKWVLLLGEARGAGCLRLERFARNALEFSAPDNDGLYFRGPVRVAGPAVLASTLPLFALVTRLAELGIPCELSEDAGGFLCNQMMYVALEWCLKNDARGGFVHLPSLEGDAPRGLPLEVQVRAVRALLRAIALECAPQRASSRELR